MSDLGLILVQDKQQRVCACFMHTHVYTRICSDNDDDDDLICAECLLNERKYNSVFIKYLLYVSNKYFVIVCV